MKAGFKHKQAKKLVTLQHESERNLSTGEVERRVYVKMYTDVRTSGLFQAMPDELWKTLCLLATYMDENGYCFPGQSELARHLSIRREAVGKRIQRLLDFRFQGHPVLAVTKTRTPKGHKRNEYTIYPISSFAIFDSPKDPVISEETTMSGQPHMDSKAMSASANMARPNMAGANIAPAHTNQNQFLNKNYTHTQQTAPSKEEGVSSSNSKDLAQLLITRFHAEHGRSVEGRRPAKRELAFALDLVERFGFERAEHVITYGVKAAARTNYEAQHFQGYEQYITEAIDDFKKEEKRAANRKAQLERERAKQQHDLEEMRHHFKRPLKERVDASVATWIDITRKLKKLNPTAEQIAERRDFYHTAEIRNESEFYEKLRKAG